MRDMGISLPEGCLQGRKGAGSWVLSAGGAKRQERAMGSPPRSLTSQVLARGVVLVMDPLGGRWVEVGLGGSKAQGVVAGPHRQADVEGVRGDDAVLIHQPPCGQLQGERRSRNELSSGHSIIPSPITPAQSLRT